MRANKPKAKRAARKPPTAAKPGQQLGKLLRDSHWLMWDEIDREEFARMYPGADVGEVRMSSANLVPFICTYDPRHRWLARPKNRVSKAGREDVLVGCPYCSGNRHLPEDSLAGRFPEIAAEWHPTKNGNKTPWDYSAKSHKTNDKRWWLCPNGHEYDMLISHRTANGYNCPYCSLKRLCDGNRLSILYPELIEEWHPTMNEKTPHDYTYGSGDRAWWICKRGHEWSTTINNRTGHASGRRCKECVQMRAYSLPAVEWIRSIEQAEGIHIRHALSEEGGEHIIWHNGKAYRVDGFCKETNTIYEYHGDYWHGNPRKYSGELANQINPHTKKTFAALYAATVAKEQLFRDLGYNLVVMWEMDYKAAIQAAKNADKK